MAAGHPVWHELRLDAVNPSALPSAGLTVDLAGEEVVLLPDGAVHSAKHQAARECNHLWRCALGMCITLELT